MPRDLQQILTKPELTELKALLGPPPVLSSEGLDHYDQIFDRTVECLGASDIVGLMLIKRYVDSTFASFRYSRHATLTIERRHRQSAEFQAKRNKEQKQRKEAAVRDLSKKIGRPPSDFAQLLALEDIVDSSVAEVDGILDRTPSELEHNRAFEAGLESIERYERLTISATARAEDARELFHHYQVVERLPKDRIVDAEYKVIGSPPQQTAAPLLAPVEERTNDIAKEDSSQPPQ